MPKYRSRDTDSFGEVNKILNEMDAAIAKLRKDVDMIIKAIVSSKSENPKTLRAKGKK